MEKRFDLTIAGEINLDLILYGFPEQMPVERELLASDFKMTLGSSSAILAHNLAALGLSVGFITRVGADPLGAIALDRLAEQGVNLAKITRSPNGTSTGVTVLLVHEGSRHILTYPGTMCEMVPFDIDLDYLASGRHFHISSLFLLKSLSPALPAICRDLKEKGLTISLDTNDDPSGQWGAPLDELLGLVDIFLPNDDEACRITNTANPEDALKILSARVPVVAIKCGKRGSIVGKGTQSWHIPAEFVIPIDTIGAGDSYNAGFLAAFLRGDTLKQCAALGNRTAAFSTLRSGGTEAFRDRRLLESLKNTLV